VTAGGGGSPAAWTSDRPPRLVPDPLPRGSETSLVLTHQMQPVDANFMGNIHGGAIMKLIDEAAGACAYRFCRTRVVTAAIDRIDFHFPVKVGNLVRFLANVNFAGRTSVEVGVRVEAEDLMTGEVVHTNSAYLVFVALDGAGKPIPVPPLEPQTDEQKHWFAGARERRRRRLAAREPADA
jgi:acyl-CoA hydrolase